MAGRKNRAPRAPRFKRGVGRLTRAERRGTRRQLRAVAIALSMAAYR
jgi:hypothetical protein